MDATAELRIRTKDEAWVDPECKKYIPIDKTQHDFVFRRNWFHHRNCCTFSTYLIDRFPPDQPWNVLTIGVFEAMQEVWLMQNILKHYQSRLVCIDPWAVTTKLDAEYMEMCMKNAYHNLDPWLPQIDIIRGYSQDVLTKAIEENDLRGLEMGEFDLLIIDGDHNALPVLHDAKLCLTMAKPGAWLLFDDVRNRVYKPDHVQHGLQMFFAEHGHQIKFEWAHRYCDCYSKV